MTQALALPFDYAPFWAWFLLFGRFGGLLTTLPGIGTDEIPYTFRVTTAVTLSAVIAMTGVSAQMPTTLAEGAMMIGTEYLLGYLVGTIPQLILGSLAVAGQVTSAAIGLGQASMIDPSIGEQVSVLSKLQVMLGITIFMLINGHHVLLRAASEMVGDVGIGMFRPGDATASILVERFSHAFETAVVITGPILVTILVTQFVLGLLTKFVPQVNVFIVSLPLTIGVGLFITAKTMPALSEILTQEFAQVEETAARLLTIP